MQKRLSEAQFRWVMEGLFGDPPGKNYAPDPRYLPIRYPPLKQDADVASAYRETAAPDRWASIWALANERGSKMAASVVPTPMVVEGDGRRYVCNEGESGWCFVRMDAKHPFSRWLLSQRACNRIGRGKVEFIAACAGSSAMRAFMYGRALASVLRTNGIPVLEVEPHLD